MKFNKSFYSLLLFSTLLTACSQEEPATTQIFPPSLSFVEPAYSETTSVESPVSQIPKVQVFPEYPTASSFLETWEDESFHAYSTMDGDETTAWVENAAGLGAGEWIEHNFQWPEQVQEISFYNGHGGNPKEFAVAKKIQLAFSTGLELIYTAEPGWNTIVLPEPLQTTFVRITLLESVASQREDVAISEIKIYNVSYDAPSNVLDRAAILEEMGALGDCSNITPEQAAAFAVELQKIMAWAETTSATRAYMGDGYEKYTGEALLFSGGYGVPVLYYDYDFPKVDELFLTQTDVIVWNGEQAVSGYFEKQGSETSINWILPGYVYSANNQYFFGLTEYDAYGSGSFGLIAMVGFDSGWPREQASYVSFISHHTKGAYTYGTELNDYLKMPELSGFPMYELEELITQNKEEYFEFDGIHFVNKNLVWDSSNYNNWYSAIRSARVDAGFEQVTKIPTGEQVLAGLLALS